MTREEAREALSVLKIYDAQWLREAVDMAIEALSANAVQWEWIKTTSGNGWNEWYVFKCPFCGATIEDKSSRSWDYNYCPSCGANMVKGGAI